MTKSEYESKIEAKLKEMAHDPRFNTGVYFNGPDVVDGELPWDENKKRRFWTNQDDANLRVYMDKFYGISGIDKITDARISVTAKRKFHPICDYINKTKWDGNARLDTLLIDYLGAEYTYINKVMTRKALVSAVMRVFLPGCKCDNVLTLIGPEGIGKSTIFRILDGEWFSDTLTTVEGKEAMEGLRHKHIIEMPELAGLKRSEAEMVKAFLSKLEDIYRPAYGRVVEHFLRQCIFVATTNEENFLKGYNGNRRFWPVHVGITKSKYSVWKDLEEVRDQIWAEAKFRFDEGESLYLGHELEKQARELQKNVNEIGDDPRIGTIGEFLDRLLPTDWKTHPVTIYRIIAKNTIDEDMIRAIDRKERSQVALLDSINKIAKRYEGERSYTNEG